MNTTLAKQSALEVLAHLACRRRAPFPFQKNPDRTWAAPCQRAIDRLERQVGLLRKPIQLVVPRVEYRRNLRSATTHVNRHLGAPGTMWGVTRDIAVASPAFCIAQLARDLPAHHLAELVCALTGLYKFAPSPTGSILDATPIATCEEIIGVLEDCPNVYGGARARLAAQLAINRLGSPYETILYLLLCLPRSLGGYGIPKPIANASIVPNAGERHLVSQSCYHPDLFWPNAGLVVEYDSNEQHSQPEKAANDSRRRNDLEMLGYAVVVATHPIIASEDLLGKVAERIRRELGLAPWRETEASRRKRFDLRRALLVAPTPLATYWR